MTDPHTAPPPLSQLPPDAYARLVREERAAGRPPPNPATVAQAAALPAVDPDLAAAWRPDRRGLRFLGLPATFGRPVRPFAVEWRQRFLATLAADERFRARVRDLLTGGRP